VYWATFFIWPKGPSRSRPLLAIGGGLHPTLFSAYPLPENPGISLCVSHVRPEARCPFSSPAAILDLFESTLPCDDNERVLFLYGSRLPLRVSFPAEPRQQVEGIIPSANPFPQCVFSPTHPSRSLISPLFAAVLLQNNTALERPPPCRIRKAQAFWLSPTRVPAVTSSRVGPDPIFRPPPEPLYF